MKKTFFFLILCFGTISPSFAQDEAETDSLADYKTACLAAIDNISLIGNNLAMRSMISVAKASLGICATKDAMRRTMTALRAGVLAYLKTNKTFTDGQVFTGLLGNHSYDTGDLSLWYSIGFDLSQISLTDITNAISGGSVSGLMNAVSVNEWNEATQATENEGTNAVQGGHEKFYLNSNQLLMQPILGLPAGIYSLSAKVACTPGLLKLNKVHLNALVVSTNVAQEILGDVLTNGNWEELLNNFDFTQYIGPFLQNGKLYTESASCKNLNTFSDGELRFIIDEGDVLIIGINAGMIPFIGTEKYRADNLQLVGLRAADNILTPAKADLAEALEGLSAIEANYNAEAEGTQPAFSYDRTLTENYNNALLSAQDKYNNDKLTDILSKSDLSNIDGLDEAVKNYYSKDIKALNDAKEAFDKQAFIAPTADELFNIVMKDDWISLLTSKWTGNAVTLDEGLTMRFSQKPGQSAFALAFGFEQASEEYSNQLRAFAYDYLDKYYLGKKDSEGLFLTKDQSQAVTITAIPSYTEEGETHLMIGDMFLGTSSSDNTLIETNSGTFLRPTRTGLSLLPASAMEIAIDIPVGQDAGTLMLPFDAELPEGFSAFSVTGISSELPYIECETATSLKANTPYCIMANTGEYTFSGVSHAIQPSYGNGLLVGRHTSYFTQGSNEYKLNTEDGLCIFCRGDGQTIGENECYLKGDFPSDIIYITRADAWDGIRTISEQKTPDVYNLSGQKMSGRLSKGIYIRDGRKVVCLP